MSERLLSPVVVAGLSRRQACVKRTLDLAVALVGAVVTAPLSVGAVVAATIDTRQCGVFAQERVGRAGRTFRVYKVRTMRTTDAAGTTVTVSGDPRVTRLGRVLRRLKIDELPQLVNVLKGEMSLVGPRPDVPGWADALCGADRAVLLVRPGITGPASLAYRHEERLLASAVNPARYNREVIWPDKVRINLEYVTSWSLKKDLVYLVATLRSLAGDWS